MVVCSCGKVIDKVPSWLASVNVEFVCNNCPNRTIKGITEVSLAQQSLRDAASLGALDEGPAPGDDEDDDEKEEAEA